MNQKLIFVFTEDENHLVLLSIEGDAYSSGPSADVVLY